MSNERIYHEKQIRQLCALHALNNLFQNRQSYTKEQLDEICSNLSPNVWINPHKSMLGLGNYDINVIMTALEIKNCEASWFDKRKDPSCIDLDVILGFIMNVPTDFKFGIISLPFQKRHWIAIKQINGKYYNLDSKLKEPECLGGKAELLKYLRNQLKTNDRELFVVIEKRNGSTPQWLKLPGKPTSTDQGDS